MNHESQSGPDLVAIRIALGFRPVPASKPLTEHEEQERDVTTVRRVLHELGQDSLNLIADLVDWNGERPWRFDRTITREGSIPNEFHEQIPDPGDRTDFSTWTYDLENTLLHIPVKHVIDRMWTQDATNEHHSPQQLRKYNPNTHG
ncbi:hypothetical protein COO72_05405 [Bifidobacterium callitrichos]|nr:hypothetical protein COO72_05405 [Bifidobacterium callitrichos]